LYGEFTFVLYQSKITPALHEYRIKLEQFLKKNSAQKNWYMI